MERRPASRRRGEELEQAILEATWEEFQELGFAGLTMEGVARRAGTSKPVLYRRWSSRLDLMSSCALSKMPSADAVPDTGSLRSDTETLLHLVRERMMVLGQPAILGMLSEVSRDREGMQLFIERFVAHLLNLMDVVVNRAVACGELNDRPIPMRLRRLPIDMARNEFLITGEVSDEAVTWIIDGVFFPALQGNGSIDAD